MILLAEDKTRAMAVATTKLVTCPDCNGAGEIHTNVTRSYWGVWESDTHPCLHCDGDCEIEFVRCESVECGVWFDPVEQLCPHAEPVCDEHRGDCRECVLDARDAS